MQHSISVNKSGLISNPRSLRIQRLKEASSASDTILSKATVTPPNYATYNRAPKSACIRVGLACIPGTYSEILIMSGTTMAALINHGTSLPTSLGSNLTCRRDELNLYVAKGRSVQAPRSGRFLLTGENWRSFTPPSRNTPAACANLV